MQETRSSAKASRPPGKVRWTLYALFAALYLLHNDLWLWNDARLVLGLPVGLAYHVAYCLVVSVALAMLVKWAWPAFASDDAEPEAGRTRDAGHGPAREPNGPTPSDAPERREAGR